MTRRISTDLCVIGAGSAGLSVAAGAVQLGRRVVLIEKGEMGGDCLNYGCVPSKALIAAASHAASIKEARKFGVAAGEPSIDFAAVMEHVRGVIAAIAPQDSQERFEGLGVTVIRAAAAFTGPREVAAGDALIRAKHFVIATGSRAIVPPIDGLASVPYFTNETIFANRVRPEHLIVIGGGPVGAELAQAHRRLGARVSIIDTSTLLGKEDPEAVDVVRRTLLDDGVALYEQQRLTSVRLENGAIKVALSGQFLTGSHILVAAGRRTNIDGLGLDKAGVRVSERHIETNARLQTTNPRIYAAGDAAGGLMFTHVAGDHASTVIRNILFKMPATRRDHLAPRATYTDPEIAAVGLSLADAIAKDTKARAVRWDFAKNDRAETERDTAGFAKVVADRNGRVLGATIVGKGAGDMIHLFARAVANRMKMSAFTAYIAPYPTRSEAAKRIGGQWFTLALFSARTRALVRLLAAFD
jgi:pyruvate/2-oxoglutarate dehydrogenase complex dihydrolipoamide dehydrogenase (E3) component